MRPDAAQAAEFRVFLIWHELHFKRTLLDACPAQVSGGCSTGITDFRAEVPFVPKQNTRMQIGPTRWRRKRPTQHLSGWDSLFSRSSRSAIVFRDLEREFTGPGIVF